MNALHTKKIRFKTFRYVGLYLLGLIFSFILNACDEEEPDPPIQPMYGVPSGEYIKTTESDVNIHDGENDIINDVEK
jgi:hypothetical protein